jgi:hypothetical protein
MPVSKAMYGMSKSVIEALKINFDAPAGIALPNLWKQDENERTYSRGKKDVDDNVRIIVWQTHEEHTKSFSC